MVHFWTSWFLAGDHLSSVSTAETLVLSLFGKHRLLLLPAVASPPLLAAFVVGWRVVLFGDSCVYAFISVSLTGSNHLLTPYLWPDAEEAAAVW